MKKFIIGALAGAFSVAGFFGSASANIITIDDGLGTIDCAPSCEAFTGSGGDGAGPTGAGVLSSTDADYYDGTPSSEGHEADRLSTLITGSTGLFSASDATRFGGSGGSQMFTTLAEYVVLKLGAVAVFVKNTSGGLLSIDYTSTPGAGSGLSHYTEFGEVEIPVPGAIWLMVAGIAGLGFSTRKKKA